jgi:UDP-glucose 4-epimerase
MKVLVTGCGGLLGSNFCEYLLKNVPDICIVGVDNLSGGYIENIPEGVKFIKGDLTNKDDQQLIKVEFPVDYIFHFAAYAAEGLSPFIRQFNYTNNVLSTAFLINCGIEFGVKRFVFTSSMAVYGAGQVPFLESMRPEPIDPYGIAKYACEMDLHIASVQHNMEYCIIRPHNVYGKNQNIWDPYRNVLGIWMYKALNNEPLTIYGDGEQTRAFSYIEDTLPCLWKAATDPRAKNEIINVGGIKEYSLNEAAEYIKEITGHNDVVYLEPRHEAKHAWCGYEKSVELLDYTEHVSFKEGLQKMWDWVKECPTRERKFWSEYELEKDIYSYWRVPSPHDGGLAPTKEKE